MINTILTAILGWLLDQLASFGLQIVRVQEQQNQISSEANSDEALIEGSQNDEDRSKAVSSVINHTFTD